MSEIAALIAEMESAGARFTREGGQVAIDLPADGLPAEHVAQLRAHKQEVIDLLRRRELLAKVRAKASRTLRALPDDRLQALVDWNVLNAFREGGAAGFRQHLAPALRDLSDGELRDLVDMEGIATMEGALMRRRGADAADIVMAGRQLAAWWLAGRGGPA